jgi:hypothetical protein
MDKERPKTGKIENFLKSKAVRITAAVALPLTAGAVAVHEDFNPVTDSVDSAKHLVLENPHKAYEQLVDIIPDVKVAEAQTPPCVWSFQVQSPDGSGTFVTGPATPPLGTGSARLFTGTHGDLSTAIHNGLYATTKLGDITKLEYSTYSISSGPATSKYPLLILDLGGGTSGPDELTFDPAVDQLQVPQLNTWQTWNALGGKWRSPLTGTHSVTIGEYMAAFGPDITIVNGATGGIRMQAGPDTPQDILNEDVDKFAIGILGANTTCDFEPGVAATPTPTVTPTETLTPTVTRTPTITPTRTPTVIGGVGGFSEMVDPKTLPQKAGNDKEITEAKKDPKNGGGFDLRILSAEVAIAGSLVVSTAGLRAASKRRKPF